MSTRLNGALLTKVNFMADSSSSPQSEKRTNLGRGLAALFGDSEEEGAAAESGGSKLVPLEHLHPNPFQPRQHFDDEALEELSASIRENGILQPILVRRHPQKLTEFEIIAGERRWRAAQKAQLHNVPVVIKDLTDQKSLEIALLENVQRQDLSALEEAMGYRRLMEEFQHTQADLAKAIGKSRSHIANTLRLLALPASVKLLLEKGELSAGHARALLSAEDPETLAQEVVSKGLTVRETEARAQGKAGPDQNIDLGAGGSRSSGNDTSSSKTPAASLPAKDADTLALERDLSSVLGLKVLVNPSKGGESGQLVIEYQTLEQLDDVIARLNQTPELD
ncbi:MAG: ParB/RepB/Spo0J family partition protein [Pseudomonadota bacterium]